MTRLAAALALACALVVTAAVAWKAQAAPSLGAKQISNASWSLRDIQTAACRGYGAHCPRFYVWNGHRCVPC